MFFYLSKLLFAGFLPFKGDFVRDQKRQNTVNESNAEIFMYRFHA